MASGTIAFQPSFGVPTSNPYEPASSFAPASYAQAGPAPATLSNQFPSSPNAANRSPLAKVYVDYPEEGTGRDGGAFAGAPDGGAEDPYRFVPSRLDSVADDRSGLLSGADSGRLPGDLGVQDSLDLPPMPDPNLATLRGPPPPQPQPKAQAQPGYPPQAQAAGLPEQYRDALGGPSVEAIALARQGLPSNAPGVPADSGDGYPIQDSASTGSFMLPAYPPMQQQAQPVARVPTAQIPAAPALQYVTSQPPPPPEAASLQFVIKPPQRGPPGAQAPLDPGASVDADEQLLAAEDQYRNSILRPGQRAPPPPPAAQPQPPQSKPTGPPQYVQKPQTQPQYVPQGQYPPPAQYQYLPNAQPPPQQQYQVVQQQPPPQGFGSFAPSPAKSKKPPSQGHGQAGTNAQDSVPPLDLMDIDRTSMQDFYKERIEIDLRDDGSDDSDAEEGAAGPGPGPAHHPPQHQQAAGAQGQPYRPGQAPGMGAQGQPRGGPPRVPGSGKNPRAEDAGQTRRDDRQSPNAVLNPGPGFGGGGGARGGQSTQNPNPNLNPNFVGNAPRGALGVAQSSLESYPTAAPPRPPHPQSQHVMPLRAGIGMSSAATMQSAGFGGPGDPAAAQWAARANVLAAQQGQVRAGQLPGARGNGSSPPQRQPQHQSPQQPQRPRNLGQNPLLQPAPSKPAGPNYIELNKQVTAQRAPPKSYTRLFDIKNPDHLRDDDEGPNGYGGPPMLPGFGPEGPAPSWSHLEQMYVDAYGEPPSPQSLQLFAAMIAQRAGGSPPPGMFPPGFPQFGGPMRGPFVPGQMGMPPMMPPQMMYGVGIPEAEYASYFPPTAQARSSAPAYLQAAAAGADRSPARQNAARGRSPPGGAKGAQEAPGQGPGPVFTYVTMSPFAALPPIGPADERDRPPPRSMDDSAGYKQHYLKSKEPFDYKTYTLADYRHMKKYYALDRLSNRALGPDWDSPEYRSRLQAHQRAMQYAKKVNKENMNRLADEDGEGNGQPVEVISLSPRPLARTLSGPPTDRDRDDDRDRDRGRERERERERERSATPPAPAAGRRERERERRPVPQRAQKTGPARYYEDDRVTRSEVQNAKQAALSNRSINESVQVDMPRDRSKNPTVVSAQPARQPPPSSKPRMQSVGVTADSKVPTSSIGVSAQSKRPSVYSVGVFADSKRPSMANSAAPSKRPSMVSVAVQPSAWPSMASLPRNGPPIRPPPVPEEPTPRTTRSEKGVVADPMDPEAVEARINASKANLPRETAKKERESAKPPPAPPQQKRPSEPAARATQPMTPTNPDEADDQLARLQERHEQDRQRAEQIRRRIQQLGIEG